MISYTNNDFSLSSPTVVALGCFDGVHTGHRAVISQAVELAKRLSLKSAVWCFDAPPKNFFLPNSAPVITAADEKLRLISELGVDVAVCVPFDMSIGSLSPEDFFGEILISKMRAAHVVCGFNYTFGKNGAGSTSLLARLCAERNVGFTALPPVYSDDMPISASAIREAISKGDTEAAARLLGRPFSLSGSVDNGNHLGRTLGFPTANIAIKDGAALPKNGVYLTRATFDGTARYGITNVGRHPTVLVKKPLAETYLFDFDGDLYGKEIRLEFLDFIRPEKKFASLDELKDQVSSDANKAMLIIEKNYS